MLNSANLFKTDFTWFLTSHIPMPEELENADKKKTDKNSDAYKGFAMLWNDLADQGQHGLSKRRVVKKRRGSGRLKGCWAQREGQPGALPKTSKDQNVCGYTNRSLATTTQRGSTPQDKGGFYQSAAVTGWFVAHVWMSVIFLPLWSSTVEGFTPQTSRIHSVFSLMGEEIWLKSDRLDLVTGGIEKHTAAVGRRGFGPVDMLVKS